MRYLDHDARSVAIFADLGTTMPHVLQYMQCLINQFMALVAVYVYNHTHTTSIMLIVCLIESPF